MTAPPLQQCRNYAECRPEQPVGIILSMYRNAAAGRGMPSSRIVSAASAVHRKLRTTIKLGPDSIEPPMC